MKFEPARYYTPAEVDQLDHQLHEKLKYDWAWQPGVWGVTADVRQASDALFGEDQRCLGKVLNAAAR